MTDSYYASVYWPARPESAEECARRTETFFRLLSQCDETFARWYEQADSAAEALQREFTPSYETFLRFFRVLTGPVLANVLRAMVLAWELRMGVIATDDWREAMRREGDRRGFSGWLTYLSRTRGEVPPLPEPARVEAMEDKGTLIILAPERLTASNPDHVSLGRRVQEVLDSKDLLRPVLS